MATSEYEKFLAELGLAFKRVRKEKGLTQSELGEEAKKPQSTIGRIEVANISDIHLRVVYEIAGALGLRLSDLIIEAENKVALGDLPKPSKENRGWEALKKQVDLYSDEDKKWIAGLMEYVLARVDVKK